MEELAGLHPILDADGARIAEIGVELRRLADEQRQEIVPAADHASHKVFIWRQLDVHARRTDELAEHGDWAREAFDAELNGILSRGLRVSDYDTALKGDAKLFGRVFRAALDGGVYLAPSAYEAGFISTAHDGPAIDRACEVLSAAIRGL